MIVDFNSPASIARWYAVHPAKHGPQLKALARIFPQWRASIRMAAMSLKAMPKEGRDGQSQP